MSYEKIVIVTRKTRLQELVERFNTKAQARFYIEHAGGNFADYELEDNSYRLALATIEHCLQLGLKCQFIDREFLPTFLFSQEDIVVALGQDGLVANIAKYAHGQPIIGINPDPARFDGILVPIQVKQARDCVESVLENKARLKMVTMAEVVLNDGQRLLGFNDLFIGAHSHISARYRLEFNAQSETHSSSGLIVSTGAGSTGWLSSVFNMVTSINKFLGATQVADLKLGWDAAELIFVVREPFISRHSQAGIVAGVIACNQDLIIESHMPSGGTIFSDGIESDFLSFNAGAIAHIRAAKQKAKLVASPTS